MDELNRRTIYRGKKIDLALQTLTLADGSEATREVVLHRGAVALLPSIFCQICGHTGLDNASLQRSARVLCARWPPVMHAYVTGPGLVAWIAQPLVIPR